MDFENAKDKTVDAEAMVAVVQSIDRMMELQNEMEGISAQLKQRQQEFDRLANEVVPSAMDAADCELFVHKTSGMKIVVEDFVQASIPVAMKEEAFKWLMDNGHEDLIKAEVKAALPKGDREIALAIRQAISEQFQIEMAFNESVHASTLKSFCKEQLAAGVALPEKAFGLYQGRVAKIKTK